MRTWSGFTFVAQWPITVLLPVFLFFGRSLLGAETGWLTVMGMVMVPVLIITLAIPPLISLGDTGVRSTKKSRFAYSISLWVLWASIVLAALTISDQADGPAYPSVLSNWTGGALSIEASNTIALVAGGISGLAYLAAFILAIAGIARGRTQQ